MVVVVASGSPTRQKTSCAYLAADMLGKRMKSVTKANQMIECKEH
jgi:hypothetical protein